MSTASPITPLWQLVRAQAFIDAEALACGIDHQLRSGDLDYRTRLLIRRGVEALGANWNKQQYDQWLGHGPSRSRLREILAEPFEEEGFGHLKHAVVMTTKPEVVEQFLAAVDGLLHEKLRIDVGGSVSAILRGYLSRHTNDVDVVNEVPIQIRQHHTQLEKLAKRWGLEVGHFQSHYLPAGWHARATWWKDFHYLTVYLIDIYDFYVCKLFSRRDKDLDDLRSLVHQLDKPKVVERLGDAAGMLAAEGLRKMAEDNWYVLYGEPMPNAS